VNAGKGAAHAAMIVGCAALLAACATVPKIRTDGTDTVPDQANLVVHIKCELTQGLFRIEERYDVARADAADFNKKHPDTPVPEPLSAAWLDKWGAKVSLKVQVEEAGTFAPNVLITDNLSNHISTFTKGGNVTFARSFTMPLALVGTAKATRTETVGFYYKFADLKAAQEADWKARNGLPADLQISPKLRNDLRDTYLKSSCPKSDGSGMEGDLKIEDFLRSNVLAGSIPGVIPRQGGATPYDTFNYEVAFVVSRAASASATWKLYPVSTNPSSTPFLAASRTKTNTMLLTLGKDDDGKASQEAKDSHLAGLIGQSVADAIRKTTP
jgi:hypothetical protein